MPELLPVLCTLTQKTQLIVKQMTSSFYWKSKINTRKIVETTINTNHFLAILSGRLIFRRNGTLE